MSLATTRSLLLSLMTAMIVAGLIVAPIPWEMARAQAATPELSKNARKIVIIDLSVDEKEHAELLREVRRALARHEDDKGRLDYDVRDVHGALNAGGESQDRQNIATAAGFIDAGNAALGEGDADDAIEQFVSARGLIESSFGVLDDRQIYSQVLLSLGEALLQSGDKRAAQEPFERAVEVRADDAMLSEEGKAAFERAKASVETKPAGAVQINTDPPYAEVYVDGRYKGISPKTVAGLIEGSHVVSVKKVGYERTTSVVKVSSEGMAHTDIPLKHARKKLLYDNAREQLVDEIEAATGDEPKGGAGVQGVGSLFRVETALVVNVEGTPETKQLSLYLFHVPTQRLLKTHKVANLDWSFRNKKAIGAAVDEVLDVQWIEVLGGEIADPDGETEDDSTVFEKWWFWTIIGVAAAGGATAAILLSQEEDTPPAFSKDGTGAIVLSF